MMNIKAKLSKAAQASINKLFNEETDLQSVQLSPTRKGFRGDYTIIVFPFTRFSRKSPEETGKEIGGYLLEQLDEIEDFNVIKGFLNLSLSDTYWNSFLTTALQEERYGYKAPTDKKVMVEYCAPNTNKPLHLGHIRNMVLGYSVSAILQAAGNEVIKVNLVNDRGIHICKSMLAWQKWGNGETPESVGVKGDQLVGKYYVLFDQHYKKQIAELIKDGFSEEEAKKEAPLIKEAQNLLQQWEANDKNIRALWKKMNEWVLSGFDETYKKLGVDFHKQYFESETYLTGKDIVAEGLKKRIFFEKEDGSVWADLEKEDLGQKLLLRADGTSVYITQDLGTAQLKYNDYRMDRSLYVVGNEQDYHFQVLKVLLKKLEKPYAEGVEHLSYGMVELPSGKMKSREGTVVDADEMMSEMIDKAKETTTELGKVDEMIEEEKNNLFRNIGLGALKFFLLKVEPKKNMLFDPNESIDLQGFTGPFVQYTYARIQSVLRKAAESDLQNDPVYRDIREEELQILRELHEFPSIVADAANSLSPASIAHYGFNVAKTYNKFYAEIPILTSEEPARSFRINLSMLTSKVLDSSMKLLGITVPEKM